MARQIKTIALAATAAVLLALAFVEVWTACEAAAWEGDSPVFAARKPGQSPTSVDADGDFSRRCQAPGVVRYFDFDTQEQSDPHIYPPSAQKVKRGKIVRDVKASGGGSLCFEILSNTPADTSGSFWLNFKDDLSAQFGEADEFYVQWRQRFSPEFLKTKYKGGGGWKQVIIGEGDRPGKTAYSCTQLEIVLVNGYHRGIVQMYHSCGGKDGQYEGLEVFDPKLNDILLQNACGCRYQQQTVPPCVGYQADQWMTFQVHVKIGTWYKNDKRYHRDSTIELWVAEEGRPSKLVISRTDYDIANDNPAAKYGKIWLLPYNTGKDASQAHATAYTWYDELIISKQRIADPAVRPSPQTADDNTAAAEGPIGVWRRLLQCENCTSYLDATPSLARPGWESAARALRRESSGRTTSPAGRDGRDSRAPGSRPAARGTG